MEITKTHLRALDLPYMRCFAEARNVNTSACISDFVERKIGCNPNIHGSRYSRRDICTTKSQLSHLEMVTTKLFELDDNEIFTMTGCLSSCEKDIYTLVPEHFTCSETGAPGKLKLQLMINQRSYEERKHYVIYDFTSFIADVGGYMGLLLGCSLFSLYNEIENIMRKFIIRPLFGHKIQQWEKRMEGFLQRCLSKPLEGNDNMV